MCIRGAALIKAASCRDLTLCLHSPPSVFCRRCSRLRSWRPWRRSVFLAFPCFSRGGASSTSAGGRCSAILMIGCFRLVISPSPLPPLFLHSFLHHPRISASGATISCVHLSVGVQLQPLSFLIFFDHSPLCVTGERRCLFFAPVGPTCC